MNRCFMLALAMVLCVSTNCIASKKNTLAKETAISRSSETYKHIDQWLRDYYKENKSGDEEDLTEDDMIEIKKVNLSETDVTYFIASRRASGSGGVGGFLVKQDNDSFKLIYSGFEFEVSEYVSNGFKDIIENYQSGVGNNYKTYLKFMDGEYKEISTTEYGYNKIFDKDLSKLSKKLKATIWTYKHVKGDGSPKYGVVIGKVKYIIELHNDNKNKLVVIEDTNNDLIAIITSNNGANIINSKFKDYKRTKLYFDWKLMVFTEGTPRDNIMTLTNVHR